MLDEKRRDDHARAVRHPAGVPELAHGGIDDGVAGLALLPGLERRGVVAPGEAGKFGLERVMRHRRETVEQAIGKLAPAEFAQEREDAAVELDATCGSMGHGVPDLARTDL